MSYPSPSKSSTATALPKYSPIYNEKKITANITQQLYTGVRLYVVACNVYTEHFKYF